MQDNVFFFIRGVETFGGKERALVNIANLLQADVNITIVTLDGTTKPVYELLPSVRLLPLSASNAFGKKTLIGKLIGFYRDWKSIYKVLRRERPQIVIGTDYIINFFLIISSFVNSKSKTVGWEHMAFDDPGMKRYFVRIKEKAYKRLNALVLLTEEKGFKGGSGVIVKCIPNIKSFVSVQKCSVKNKQILTIARLTGQKGIDILLDVIKELKQQLNGWRFILVASEGEKPMEWLLRQIEEKGITKEIEVRQPTSHIIDYYLECSLYLMTSRYEGLPMVLIEAMECGLPCISFDCPTGPADIIIDGVNGFLAECFDKKVLCDKILMLITSDELRSQFAVNTALSADKFNKDRVREKWLALFKEIA